MTNNADAEPTTAQLYERLDGFLEALDYCKYIDDYWSMVRCQERNQVQINRIRAAIKQREDQARAQSS